MLNAIMHVIVEEELYDQQYIDAYTENWPAMKEHSEGFHARKDGRDLRHCSLM